MIGETKTINITQFTFKNLTYFWDTRCGNGSNTYLKYQLSKITTTTITYRGWMLLNTGD